METNKSVPNDLHANDYVSEDIVGCLYRHYKGHVYRVIAIGYDTETLEQMVVYTDDKYTWVRPARMWNELVDTPLGKVHRFEVKEGATR